MVSEEMKKDGPGIWLVLHVLGVWADTPDKVKIYCTLARFIINYMRCEDCRNHASQYLKDFPPENATSMFIWSWEFHNFVNKRLEKPEMPYATARSLYVEGKIKNCGKDCGEKK